MRRFTFVCDERRARAVERLARENDLTEREVLDQLLELGLELVDERNEGRADGEHVHE